MNTYITINEDCVLQAEIHMLNKARKKKEKEEILNNTRNFLKVQKSEDP